VPAETLGVIIIKIVAIVVAALVDEIPYVGTHYCAHREQHS